MSAHASDLAYPLQWPEGQPRTPRYRRAQPRFKQTLGSARDFTLAEIKRLGGRYPVISSDLRVRLDGLPYANQREPEDPGVAVFFELKGEQLCFGCDRWRKIRDNLYAIGKTIEALRGIERWGSSEAMHRAFRGFQALPAGGDDWRAVLGLGGDRYPLAAVKARYRELAARSHPDRGGSHHEMQRLNAAYAAAEKELTP